MSGRTDLSTRPGRDGDTEDVCRNQGEKDPMFADGPGGEPMTTRGSRTDRETAEWSTRRDGLRLTTTETSRNETWLLEDS